MALNERQRAFVNEYLKDFNATQAAIRAGYSKKTAYSLGSENLKKAEIQEMLRERIKKREERTEITQDMVIKELAKIAFANVTDAVKIEAKGLNRVKVLPTNEMPDDIISAIGSIKEGPYGVEIKLHDKLRAHEDLGKHLGLFDNNASTSTQENNILDVIGQDTGEDVMANEIREIEQAAEHSDDLVE